VPPTPSSGDGKRSSLRKVVFVNTVRWTKSQNPLILIVVHRRQNPLESIWELYYYNDNGKDAAKVILLSKKKLRIGGWNQGPLRPLNGLLCQPQMTMVMEKSVGNDWHGKPKYSEETCPSAALSTTNPTCCPYANPGRRGV
jgi:hypothetical protein